MGKYSRSQKTQQGDTLVEVLLAIAVLSAIIVAVITLMNYGHAMGRDSLERSQVTALMTEQSEMLQYIRDSYANAPQEDKDQYPAVLWKDLSTTWTAAVEPAGCKINTKPFFLDRTFVGAGKDFTTSIQAFDGTTISEGSSNYVSTYAKPGSGLWVEAERPAAGSVGVDYINFHIKACWSPSGQGPKQEAKTVVRLYMPGEVPGGGGGGGGGGSCKPVAIGQETFFLDSSAVYHMIDWEPSRMTYSLSPPILSNIKGGCRYNITLQAADYSHPHTPPDDSQAHEQISAWFYKNGSLVTSPTGLTDDFLDNTQLSTVKNMGDFCFDDTPDTLTFKAYYATTGINGWSSVQPYKINLTPVSKC